MSELRDATGCKTVVPFGAEVPCAAILQMEKSCSWDQS